VRLAHDDPEGAALRERDRSVGQSHRQERTAAVTLLLALARGRAVRPSSRRRIRCGGVVALAACGKPARWCEYVPWSSRSGVSFFYYCGACWRAVGPDGQSAAERALSGAPLVGWKTP
jgi:hypothetical protein